MRMRQSIQFLYDFKNVFSLETMLIRVDSDLLIVPLERGHIRASLGELSQQVFIQYLLHKNLCITQFSFELSLFWPNVIFIFWFKNKILTINIFSHARITWAAIIVGHISLHRLFRSSIVVLLCNTFVHNAHQK